MNPPNVIIISPGCQDTERLTHPSAQQVCSILGTGEESQGTTS